MTLAASMRGGGAATTGTGRDGDGRAHRRGRGRSHGDGLGLGAGLGWHRRRHHALRRRLLARRGRIGGALRPLRLRRTRIRRGIRALLGLDARQHRRGRCLRRGPLRLLAGLRVDLFALCRLAQRRLGGDLPPRAIGESLAHRRLGLGLGLGRSFLLLRRLRRRGRSRLGARFADELLRELARIGPDGFGRWLRFDRDDRRGGRARRARHVRSRRVELVLERHAVVLLVVTGDDRRELRRPPRPAGHRVERVIRPRRGRYVAHHRGIRRVAVGLRHALHLSSPRRIGHAVPLRVRFPSYPQVPAWMCVPRGCSLKIAS